MKKRSDLVLFECGIVLINATLLWRDKPASAKKKPFQTCDFKIMGGNFITILMTEN